MTSKIDMHSTKARYLLQLEEITKAFPNVLANNHISFDLQAGEIHALLGENGSGKTTLMKVLYGIYKPDSGRIRIEGKEVAILNPRDAVAQGIGMVHQNFMLVPSLTVLENLMLGFELRRGPILDFKRLQQDVEEVFANVGLPMVPLNNRISTLSVGEQQRIEIIKALLHGAKILILDEPTAVLTPQEVERLGKVLLKLRSDGYGIVLITHKLDEVFEFSDRVTVLRRGERVASMAIREVDKAGLANLMVGRQIENLDITKIQPCEKEILSLSDVSVCSYNESQKLERISLAVHQGEIFGIAGISGNGQRTLADVIFGLQKHDEGEIRFDGHLMQGWNVAKALNLGIGYIPEDRQTVGLVLNFTIEENLVVKDSYLSAFSNCGVLNWMKIHKNAETLIQKFDIRPPQRNMILRWMSGGNQQKVIVARELSPENCLIIAAEPTRGLDVGSVDYVHRMLLEQRKSGKGVILISTDLDEVMKLSDRVAVLFRGRIIKTIERGSMTRGKLGLLMAGVTD